MTTCRLIYKSRPRNGTILTKTTEHPQFPVENIQDDILVLPWRSRYGTGTGNGNFVVASTNKYIYLADGNVVTDSGMETWASATNLTNWTEVLAGTSTVTRSTDKRTGTYCASLIIDGSNSNSYIYQGITMAAATEYQLSIWYKTEAGKTAGFVIENTALNVYLKSDGTWTAGYTEVTLPTATSWTNYKLVFTSHASYTNYYLLLQRISAASSTVYFDDVTVCKTATATLTEATYTGASLATEIKTRLDAAGETYTVSYSVTTGKFTITNSGPYYFSMRWNGTSNNAVGLLGFGSTVDSTGATTYTSTTAVIHTSESVDFDFGAAYAYDSVALMNHNLTSAAVVTVYGADDSAFTSNVVSDVITYNANNMFQFLGAARTKRYCRLHIVDVANPSMYVQVGCFVVGKYLQPNRNFGPYSEGEVDESEIELSPSSNAFTVQERTALVNRELSFKGLDATTIAEVRLLLAECGVRKAIWLCTDSTAANTYSYWVRLKETALPRCEYYGYWTWDAPVEQVL